MRPTMRHSLTFAASAMLLLLLSACGGRSAATPTPQPTAEMEETSEPTEPAAATDEAAVTSTPVPRTPTRRPTRTATVTATPTATPTAVPTRAATSPPTPQNRPLDAVRGVLISRGQQPDRINATLYQHLTTTVLNGESLVFHWEDSYSGAVVGCSGHAVTQLGGDGLYTVQTISAYCGSTQVATPITIFSSQGIDPSGQAITVIFGEIYSAAVASIRVAYGGGEVNALIVGGGWYAEVPFDSTGITASAHDAGGGVLQQGAPAAP